MNNRQSKNILLVEDQIVIALRQKIELEKKSYTVTHASSSQEAIDIAFEKHDSLDLILMDIDLGEDLDGIEVAKQIICKHDIPILFLSSYTDPEIVSKTEMVTSYGYVVKDSGITVLDASIKMAFKLHESRRSEQQARVKAEKALQLSETYLGQVIDRMLEGFLLVKPIFNADDIIIDIEYLRVNAAAERITGIPANEFIGKTARQLFNNNIEDVYFEKHNQVFKSGQPAKFVEKFEELNHWYELSFYKVDDDKLAIFFNDITDSMLANEALKKSETKYKSLFDYMAQEIHFWQLVRDESGEIKTWRLVDANPPALKSWRKIREDIIGKTTDEIFPGANATELFMPIVKKIFETGEPYSWETYYEATNQHLFMTSVPFGDYFISTGIDITDNKLLKQQLMEKETLVKEVLHRTKNSFSSLMAILKLQTDHISNKEALNAINESTARIESMRLIYEKLLMEDGHQYLNIKDYVEDLAQSIINLTSDNYLINLELGIDDFIIGENKIFPIGAIINELITNSIKHAFTGVENMNIKLCLKMGQSDVNLNYQDNGIGLPEGFDITKSGLGLMLIDLFSKQLNGNYNIKSSNGFQFNMTFKV